MARPDAEQGVVIPAISTASSTAAIRSLGRKGIKTIAISEHESPPGFRSKYCNERIPVPDPATDLAGYEEALRVLARRPDVETILPFREADIYVLAKNKEYFSRHVGPVWPTIEMLNNVQDRIKLREAALNAGISLPTTKSLDKWDDWSTPAVIKPRYTVHAPEYNAEFERAGPELGSTRYVPSGTKPEIAEVVAEMGHVPIVQAYIPTTDEYGFFAQYKDGEAVATFQHRQRRGWKYVGGPSAYRESVSIPELEQAGRALLDELAWEGVAMVEFLRDPKTGEFKLMEINPRFWSSLPFTVQAGVDFPFLFYQQATGMTIQPQHPYKVGIGGHLLRGEALHLHSILREEYPLVDRPSFVRAARDIAVSLVTQPRFDYLSRDDPGPFIGEITTTVRSVAPSASVRTRENQDENTTRTQTAIARVASWLN